ncbi:MAG: hypothetical protein ABWY12_13660 [Burkholderiales bacterium]
MIQKRRALIDEIDGRTVLVFVDQATFIPAALYMEASRATMEGREIRHDPVRSYEWARLPMLGATR